MEQGIKLPDARVLTPKEITLVRALADGLSNAQQAEMTGYTEGSVGVMRSLAVKKAGCTSSAHLVAVCIRQKLIS